MDDTILIVDDTPFIVKMISLALSAKGYGHIDKADNGQDALYKLTHGVRPILIITSTDMPYVDGVVLTKKIREITRHKNTPILVVSSRCNKSTTCVDCEKLGANGILKKPFKVEELYEAVDKLTNDSYSQSEAICAYSIDFKKELVPG